MPRDPLDAMPRRATSSLVAIAAAVLLAGCVMVPPQPNPVSSDPSATNPGPSSVAAGGDVDIDVAGSVAVVRSDRIVWQLEILAFEAAPLDQLAGSPDGGPAPAAPAGMVVAWACMAATLVDAPDGFASLADILEVEVDGGDHGRDYQPVDSDLDVFSALISVGETIEPTCPILLVPEGTSFEAVTLVVSNDADDTVEAAVLAP